MRNIQINKRLRKEGGTFELYNNILASSPSSPGMHDTDIGDLKMVIDYFTSMRNKGKINDKQLSALITNLCANFIANEMAAILNNVLAKAFKGIFEEYINE